MAPFSTDPAGLAERCLGAVREARALVVGDVMLDRYVSGTVDRVSPEAPVPVVHERRRRQAPGGAANVAAGIRALGAEVRLVGVVGDDGAGAAVRRALSRRGIAGDDVATVPGRPTTTKTRILSRHQQVLRIDREDPSPLPPSSASTLAGRAVEHLADCDVVVLQDYDKGVLSPATIEPIVAAARRGGVPIVVDPKLRNFFGYRGATVFKPNRGEAATALGLEELTIDLEALRGLAARAGCDHLVVTLGAAGLCLLERGSTEPALVPSRAREVYDVSGAGDTVTAVLAASLAAGVGISDAAVLANVAAGVAVSRLGARPVGARALAGAARQGMGPERETGTRSGK